MNIRTENMLSVTSCAVIALTIIQVKGLKKGKCFPKLTYQVPITFLPNKRCVTKYSRDFLNKASISFFLIIMKLSKKKYLEHQYTS